MARGRKLETLDDFKRSLKNKYGLGEGSAYKPWLRVQDVKSRGQSSKIQGLKVNREHHTLSKLETQFFYLAEFSESVIDIREQFPLLPLSLSSKISSILDIEPPKVPSSGDFNVLTTDFLLTRSAAGKIWYEAYNVKPDTDLTDYRTAEKIELERVWWELLGVKFHLFTGNKTTKNQAANIAWATDPLRHGSVFELAIEIEAVKLIPLGIHAHADICDLLSAKLAIDGTNSLNLLQTLIAKKLITVNLDNPIVELGIIEVKSTVNHEELYSYGA